MTKNMKAGVSTNSRLDRMSRRRVLEFAFGLALGTSGGARLVMAQSPPPCPENIGVHNMMVFGERSVFLSHLPMFVGLCPDRAHFQTEHRFQFIVEATFEQPRTQRDVTELYKQDRKQHRDIRMYSLGPQERFALAEIFMPPGSGDSRRSFRADVHRGHLERLPEDVIKGLGGIDVRIKRVVHAHEFHPQRREVREPGIPPVRHTRRVIPGPSHSRAGRL